MKLFGRAISLFVICGNAIAMMHHGDFAPLACNSALDDDTTPCDSFAAQGFDLVEEPVVVPCGTCLVMDLVGNLTFHKGLDIQGKLIFPSDRGHLKITTPYIFVQGELIIEDLPEAIVPQPDRQLEFHFVGTDDVQFTSHPTQVFPKCAGGCNVSKKPFVVAGGNVDIRGMRDHCQTWTRIQSTGDAGSAAILPPPTAPRDDCMGVLVSETFEIAAPALAWDGRGAGYAAIEDGYFSVKERTSSTQGPRVYLPLSCIHANKPYVVRFRYRYRDSSTEEFVVPYLKLIRTRVSDGGNDWMNVNEVYGRGQLPKVTVDEWHQLEWVIQFDHFMVSQFETSDLALYAAPFSDVDTIDIDDFVLELAPVQEDRSCDSLLVRDATSEAAYPFYTYAGILHGVTDGDGPETSYIRSTNRYSKYSSPYTYDLPAECLVEAAVYEFSADVRVHSSEATQLSISLSIDGAEETLVVCPPSQGDWVHCEGRIRLESGHEGATTASLKSGVIGDLAADIDLANAKLDYVGGRAITIVPEDLAGISDCWAPGAEILVTSHTTLQEDAQVATIASIGEEGSITLAQAIHDPITVEDDTNTAVEVALLTRNVKFTAADDDEDDPLHGGHLIIMHTPAPIIQTLVGIESHGFGQQGKLGRYPFHFHMCGSVAGSVLSKNSVRNTKQRGIVVHGSNDLFLEGNILHNIRGHGFMLEDGAEQGNTFLKNLGAVSYPVDTLISDAESDNAPSTFWITNPQNKWIGNVAAGSAASGFWFEVKEKVRGPSAAMFPDMVPNKLDLLEFTDNTSHGSARGLQTYPQAGYRPEHLAVFQNHKSYRNRIAGVFFHAGGRLSIDGGYLSDNPIGVDIDMDHSDVISNTRIVGSSEAYLEVLRDLGVRADRWPQRGLCSSDKPLVGIRLDSYHDGSLFGATGSRVAQVSFSGFGSCPGSSAFHVDREDVQYFDTRNQLESITVTDDSPKINLCNGEPQVVIRIVDDSFFGEPGFVVSDTSAIKAHPDCVSLEGTCAAFCPRTCLRTITVMIPPTTTYERGSLTLHVAGTLPDGRPITPIEVEDFQTKAMLEPDKESSHGRFFVTLPAGGSYTANFVDTASGLPTWPVYTDLRYEDAIDNCGPDFASFVVDTLVPEQCDQLVRNGDFEAGNFEHWRYAGHYGLEMVQNDDGAADGGAYSLRTPNAEGGGWVGPGQYLDTRCIEEGYVYSVTAKIKLTDSATGAVVGCDLHAYSNAEDSCPRATFRFTNRLHGETPHSWKTVGYMETADQEWNTLRGSYVATEYAGAAHSVFLYITGVRKGIDITVDDVEVTRSEATPEPTLVPTGVPTVTPTGTPTVSPTAIPTVAPTSSPSQQELSEEGPPALFEGSSASSITFEAGGSIKLESTSQEASTVLSTEAHSDTPGGDLELIVRVPDRDFTESGYQPSLVLFFAPGSTPIEDVTTPDNGFHNFEGSVVAYANHRMFPTLGSYFKSKAKQEDGSFAQGSTYARTLPLPTSGTALKLTRRDGAIRSFYSLDDGATWTKIGGEYLLAPEYQRVPLKVGYRLYLEYKRSYRLVTIPSITSGGEVVVTPPPQPQNYFDGTNADLDSAECNVDDGCRIYGSRNVAKLLSHETFEGDLSFVTEFVDRPIFGSGYQSGLWLFLVPAEATLDSISNSDGAFRDYAVGTVGDKIYATMDHTWVYSSSLGADGTSRDQYLGQRWKNTGGFYKLERVGGSISSYISPNGNTWTRVGQEVDLPPELANAPVRVGYRVSKNWAPGYEFKVMATVSSVAQSDIDV